MGATQLERGQVGKSVRLCARVAQDWQAEASCSVFLRQAGGISALLSLQQETRFGP